MHVVELSTEDFFILNAKNRGDVVSFQDRQGETLSRRVETGQIETLFRLLDSQPKSVRRHSGGKSSAQISRVVVAYDSVGEDAKLFLKVQIEDIEVSKSGGRFIRRWKTLPLNEVLQPFSPVLEGTQHFVVDFGQGPIPIYIFQFGQDETGREIALFTTIDFVTRVATAEESELTQVQLYSIPRAVVRFASELSPLGSEHSELAKAKANFQRLQGLATAIVPDAIRIGAKIPVPKIQSSSSLRRYLRKAVSRFAHSPIDGTQTVAADELTGSGLLSFGFFEAA